MTSEIQIQVQILNYVRELISNGWIQNAAAMDEEGNQTNVYSMQACKFCLSGAIERGALVFPREEVDHAYWEVAEHIGNMFGRSIVQFNDYSGRKKEDIIKVLDNLISEEEKSHANL